MSSEIYYEKAFISIGNKFIPLVCHGSTNTYEFNHIAEEASLRVRKFRESQKPMKASARTTAAVCARAETVRLTPASSRNGSSRV